MEERRRPLGIWIIVILEIVNATITLIDIAFGVNLTDARFQEVANQNDVTRAVFVGWSALVLIAAVSLWMLRRRGWALMMLLVGIGLAGHLGVWWLRPDDTPWVRMGISVITAFYLNSAAVRQLFITRREISRISLGGRSAE